MGKLYLIKSSGEIFVEQRDSPPALQDLQGMVGGYIEVIHVPGLGGEGPAQLIVNEEGLYDGLPTNYIATALARGLVNMDPVRGVVGDCVLIIDEDVKIT